MFLVTFKRNFDIFYNTIEYSGSCKHWLNELQGKDLDVSCSMLS
jgi:hypothetical protein